MHTSTIMMERDRLVHTQIEALDSLRFHQHSVCRRDTCLYLVLIPLEYSTRPRAARRLVRHPRCPPIPLSLCHRPLSHCRWSRPLALAPPPRRTRTRDGDTRAQPVAEGRCRCRRAHVCVRASHGGNAAAVADMAPAGVVGG